MTTRGFTLQPIDPFSGRPLGPAQTFHPLPAQGQADEALPAAPSSDSPDQYPEGANIEGVLAWVDDPDLPDAVRSDRAKAALAAEHDREKPRKTLLAELSERTR